MTSIFMFALSLVTLVVNHAPGKTFDRLKNEKQITTAAAQPETMTCRS